MKATVISPLNKRLLPSTRNTPLPHPHHPNDIIEIVEEVEGEAPQNSKNNKWYKTNQGYYVWSEGVNISKTSTSLGVLGRSVNYNIALQNISHDLRSASTSIKIALIDSGVTKNHSGLICLENPQYDFSGSAFGADDTVGHGSHCAGLIAGNFVSSDGVNGMAPLSKIYSYKARHESFKVTAGRLRKSIDQAVKDKCDIISMSLNIWDYSDQKLKDSIAAAHQAGIIMVAAAGEDEILLQNEFYYPAYFDEVISAGAVTAKFATAGNISKINPKVDFVLPLIEFTSCSIKSLHDYQKLAGSSMSTALMAGVISLVLSLKGKISQQDVVQYLKTQALKLTTLTNNNDHESKFHFYTA